jgi:hypothetical protein
VEVGYLDKATRAWNVAMILDDLEEYKKADGRLRVAIERYDITFDFVLLLIIRFTLTLFIFNALINSAYLKYCCLFTSFYMLYL